MGFDRNSMSPTTSVALWRSLLLMLFAVLYGGFLQALPVLQFKDRLNYLNYAENSWEILNRYSQEGLVVLLANEPAWLSINAGLATVVDPETVIRVIIFTAATVFSYVFIRADPKNAIWLVAFLLMPQLLKNFITHLRQGLGLAVFFAGYFAVKPPRRWLLMLIAPLIHASFFFVLAFVLLPRVLSSIRLAVDVRLVVMAIFALTVSLSLGILAALVGARQLNQYDFSMADVSGLGFAFWAVVFLMFLVQGRGFLAERQEAAGVLLLYLLSYFFLEVTGRIFESGMPLVLLAGLSLRGGWRLAFATSFLGYSTLSWVVRLSTDMPF